MSPRFSYKQLSRLFSTTRAQLSAWNFPSLSWGFPSFLCCGRAPVYCISWLLSWFTSFFWWSTHLSCFLHKRRWKISFERIAFPKILYSILISNWCFVYPLNSKTGVILLQSVEGSHYCLLATGVNFWETWWYNCWETWRYRSFVFFSLQDLLSIQ